MLRWGSFLVVVGILLGLTGVVGVAVKAGSGLRADFTAPVESAPTVVSRDLTPGTYMVFELTGTTRRVGPLTTSRDTGVTLTPDEVRVTAADGTPVAVDVPTTTETLTRGQSTFTGAVRFVISSRGTYRIAVGAPGIKVIVAPSFASSFGRSLAWIGVLLLGGLLAVAGVVILIVRLVRRKRVVASPVEPATGSWFPDPSGAPYLRWWDGYRWTDHTS